MDVFGPSRGISFSLYICFIIFSKIFVIFSKICVIFSMTFVIFSKTFVIFSSFFVIFSDFLRLGNCSVDESYSAANHRGVSIII